MTTYHPDYLKQFLEDFKLSVKAKHGLSFAKQAPALKKLEELLKLKFEGEQGGKAITEAQSFKYADFDIDADTKIEGKIANIMLAYQQYLAEQKAAKLKDRTAFYKNFQGELDGLAGLFDYKKRNANIAVTPKAQANQPKPKAAPKPTPTPAPTPAPAANAAPTVTSVGNLVSAVKPHITTSNAMAFLTGMGVSYVARTAITTYCSSTAICAGLGTLGVAPFVAPIVATMAVGALAGVAAGSATSVFRNRQQIGLEMATAQGFKAKFGALASGVRGSISGKQLFRAAAFGALGAGVFSAFSEMSDLNDTIDAQSNTIDGLNDKIANQDLTIGNQESTIQDLNDENQELATESDALKTELDEKEVALNERDETIEAQASTIQAQADTIADCGESNAALTEQLNTAQQSLSDAQAQAAAVCEVPAGTPSPEGQPQDPATINGDTQDRVPSAVMPQAPAAASMVAPSAGTGIPAGATASAAINTPASAMGSPVVGNIVPPTPDFQLPNTAPSVGTPDPLNPNFQGQAAAPAAADPASASTPANNNVPPVTPVEPQVGTVAENDSLWKIAEAHLGEGASNTDIHNYVNLIVEANADANPSWVENPDKIFPGQEYVLPAQPEYVVLPDDVPAPSERPTARAPASAFAPRMVA